ncbi:unnamed protein product [Ectocarpus sp. 12 AP-2014]
MSVNQIPATLKLTDQWGDSKKLSSLSFMICEGRLLRLGASPTFFSPACMPRRCVGVVSIGNGGRRNSYHSPCDFSAKTERARTYEPLIYYRPRLGFVLCFSGCHATNGRYVGFSVRVLD